MSGGASGGRLGVDVGWTKTTKKMRFQPQRKSYPWSQLGAFCGNIDELPASAA